MLLDIKKFDKSISDNKISYKKNIEDYNIVLDYVNNKIKSIEQNFSNIENTNIEPLIFFPWIKLDLDKINYKYSYNIHNYNFFNNTKNKEENYFKFPSSFY